MTTWYTISALRKKNTFRSLLCRFIFLFFLLPTTVCKAHSYTGVTSTAYDEVVILFKVQDVGNTEMQAVVQDEELYIPVCDLFDYLKIFNVASPGFDSVSGFFLHQNNHYLISRVQNRITYQDKIFTLAPGDLILNENGLYLNTRVLKKVFGLDFQFNFRSLSVIIKSDHELPVIREKRQEQLRHNLTRLKGQYKADTIIPRNTPFFRLGAVDWNINTTQHIKQQSQGNQLQKWNEERVSLSLGAMLAGGETNVQLNYFSNLPFTHKNQYYSWRYVDNSKPFLRQVTAGRINTQTISSIFSPAIGLQFTNASTNKRQTFGSYRISDITEPNWIVELYINNLLVDYVQADSNGLFSFDVPLVYGNSTIKFHFYGPWGEERISEKNMTIPFSFLPPGETEYTVSAGIIENEQYDRFSRININYGLTRYMTVGAGIEYLSSITSNPVMPFINTSMRFSPGLIFSGEYTHNVRSKGVLRYQTPSNLNLEVVYTKYKRGQKAIIYHHLEERKAVLSKPFKIRKLMLFSQLSFSQIILPESQNTNSEFLFSATFSAITTRVTNHVILQEARTPYLFSIFYLSLRLPARIFIVTQAQYDHNRKSFISFRSGVEKHIKRQGFLTFSYEKNLVTAFRSFEIGFRYNFSFSQAALLTRFNNNSVVTVQSAKGGISYNHNSRSPYANTRINVGKGAVSIVSFLDINGDGKRNPGEAKVAGVIPSINGALFEYNSKDTSYAASNLSPYTDYRIELVQGSSESISWQLKNKSIQVTIEPNYFQQIEVPVLVVGEVSGTISFNDAKGKRGIGRIKINFYKNDSILVGSTVSEEDGYFSFLGLPPGSYKASVDPSQLSKLWMTAFPEALPFDIRSLKEGDIVDGLEINLGRQE